MQSLEASWGALCVIIAVGFVAIMYPRYYERVMALVIATVLLPATTYLIFLIGFEDGIRSMYVKFGKTLPDRFVYALGMSPNMLSLVIFGMCVFLLYLLFLSKYFGLTPRGK